MMHLKSVFTIVCFLLIFGSNRLVAQDIEKKKESTLCVKIKAKANKERLSTVETWITKIESTAQATSSIQNTSKLSYEFNLHSKYEIVIKPEGYLQKRFIVNTHLPSSIKEGNDKFPTFEITLVFYKEVPSIPSNTYKNSLGEIAYNPEVDNFVINSYVREFQPQQQIEEAYSLIQKYDIANVDRDEIIEKGNKLLEKGENYSAYLLFKLAKDSTNEERVNSLIQQSSIEIEKDDQFAVRMLQANNHYYHKNYEEAATLYAEASKIKPDYSYARQQLAYLEKEEQITPKLLEANNKPEALLENLIKAENALSENNVTLASQIYFDVIKDLSVAHTTETQFRVQSIGEEINKLVFGEEWTTLEVKFNQLLDKASDEAMYGNLEEARDLYFEAKATGYSKKGIDIDVRIKRIEAMISRVKKASELQLKERKFDEYSAKARQLAARGDFEGAHIYYTKVKDLNLSGEQYNVDSKLDALNSIIRSSKTQTKSTTNDLEIYSYNEKPKSNDKIALYDYYIQYGDRAILENKYTSARFYFSKALGIHSSEHYPKQQLKFIKEQVQLDLNAKMDKQYAELIEKADLAVVEKKWSTAKFYLSKAIEIKPEASYPKVQLQKIRTGEYL